MNKGMIDTVKVGLLERLKIETDPATGQPVIRGIRKSAYWLASLLEFRNKQIDKLRDERDTLREELNVITGTDAQDTRQRLSALVRRRKAIDTYIVELENRND